MLPINKNLAFALLGLITLLMFFALSREVGVWGPAKNSAKKSDYATLSIQEPINLSPEPNGRANGAQDSGAYSTGVTDAAGAESSAASTTVAPPLSAPSRVYEDDNLTEVRIAGNSSGNTPEGPASVVEDGRVVLPARVPPAAETVEPARAPAVNASEPQAPEAPAQSVAAVTPAPRAVTPSSVQPQNPPESPAAGAATPSAGQSVARTGNQAAAQSAEQPGSRQASRTQAATGGEPDREQGPDGVAGKVEYVDLLVRGNRMVLILQADAPVQVTYFELPEPDRLVVDLLGQWNDFRAPGAPKDPGSIVTRVRFGRRDDRERMVLELKRPLEKRTLNKIHENRVELIFE